MSQCADCGVQKQLLARGMCAACYGRARRRLNPEESRAWTRKWQARNAVQFRACMATWRKNNPDKHNAAKRRWEDANPGRHLATARVWKAANRELVLQLNAKRRALKLAAPVNDFTAQQWVDMKARHLYQCFYCGTSDKPLTQDHQVPLSRGGSHTESNIVPACQSCNSRKRTKDFKTFCESRQ